MKKRAILFLFLVSGLSVFAQRLSTVGISPFEAADGVSDAEAGEAARLVAAELGSWGTMTVLSGDEAENGEYLVRGRIAREGGRIVLTAATYETRSGKSLNNSKEEAAVLAEIPFLSFCAQIAENIPFPNYLLGTWQSTVNTAAGPLICILEFRSDRTVRAGRYDTWEHSGTTSLKYQAIGGGTYSYAGFLRRTVTIGGRQIQTDASVGLRLNLEDALPKYSAVRASGVRILFDDSKSSFEAVSGGFPCGDNKSGPSVYPLANVYYTKFTKIQ